MPTSLTRDWLGPRPRVDREAALAELARRYLVGHGPATIATWPAGPGLPLRDARAGLAAIAAELDERDDGPGRAEEAARESRALPQPLLLGAFDPLLLGWCSRADVVGPHEGLVTSSGLFRPLRAGQGPGGRDLGLRRRQGDAGDRWRR